MRVVARVDDPFHGFEVVLDLVGPPVPVGAGGAVAGAAMIGSARATAHRHPWTTCPGALASVGRLVGPLADAPARAVALDRADTCVHVNDLVWFAARGHAARRYEMVVTPSLATLACDGEERLVWPLADWRIASGPWAGRSFADRDWPAVLAAAGVGEDEAEAVRVLRRAVAVAMGYHELDWEHIRTGTDVPAAVMAGSCHTFSPAHIATTRCLVDPPVRRGGA